MASKKFVYGFNRVTGELLCKYPSVAEFRRQIGGVPDERNGVIYMGNMVYNISREAHAPKMRHSNGFSRPSTAVYDASTCELVGIYESAGEAADEWGADAKYLRCLLGAAPEGECVEVGDYLYRQFRKDAPVPQKCQPMPHRRVAVYTNRGNFRGVFGSLKEAVYALFPHPEKGVSHFLRRMQWRVITDLQEPPEKIRAVPLKCHIKVTLDDGTTKVFRTRSEACKTTHLHPDILERRLRSGSSLYGIKAEWVRELPESADNAPTTYAVLVITPGNRRYYYKTATAAAGAFGVSVSTIGYRARKTHMCDRCQVYAIDPADAEGKEVPPRSIEDAMLSEPRDDGITATVVSRRIVRFK